MAQLPQNDRLLFENIVSYLLSFPFGLYSIQNVEEQTLKSICRTGSY